MIRRNRKVFARISIIKSNSPIIPGVVLACLGYFWFALACFSLLPLVVGCFTCYKKVKAHKAHQKLEALKKVKARNKMKAHNASEKMRAREVRKKFRARKTRKKMMVRKARKI